MYSKTPVVFWLCVSGLLTGSIFLPSISTSARNTNKQQIIQQMAQAQIAVQQDNEQLRKLMNSTLDAFKKYCRKTGGIPHTERHIAYLEHSLSVLAGVNPFNEFPFRIAADGQSFTSEHDTTGGDRRKIAVFLKCEANLNAADLANWRRNKPENWVEMPGSITILHDGRNACCVWGAGVDGCPIKVDDKTAASDIFTISDEHVMR